MQRKKLMTLQRVGGNAAVAGLLEAKSVQREPTAPTTPAPAATGERAKIDKALQSAAGTSPDSSLVKDIDDFGQASKDERIKLARCLVYHYTAFFGPRDRSCLTRIYESFGEDVKYVADKDPFLMEKCLKEWPGLMFDLKPVKTAGDGFKNAISTEARQNLVDNITYLKNEKKRMFGAEGPTPEAVLEDSKRQSERATAMVVVAEKIQNLRKKQEAMLDKVVGFKYQEHNPVAPSAPVKFTPGKPPQHKHDAEPTYDSLNESWDAASMLIGMQAAKYPWLFGILKDPDTADARLQELVAQKNNPTAARVQIMSEMQTQITRAEAVEKSYKAKEPDWYDLVPLRERLFNKALDKNFERAVARQVVGNRDDAEWWKKVGLETATMAALLVASFATAGAAPVIAGVLAGTVAVGIPAAEAYAAYEKANQMQEANQATVLPDTELVTQSQVDAAKAEALAKVIEALLNATLLAGEGVMAARFELQLSRLAEYAPTKQAELLAKAVAKPYGPVGAATRTGMSLGEILAKVGPDTEAGKLIQKQIVELAGKPVGELTAEQRAALRTVSKDAGAGVAEGAERTLSDPAVGAKLTAEAQELVRTWTQMTTMDARLAFCRSRAVEILKEAGVEVEITVVDATMGPGTWGSFNPGNWTIKLDRAVLADNNASAHTINEMMKTVLHESRHAEQYWLMARRLYGKNWLSPAVEEALGLDAKVLAKARNLKILDTDANAKMIDVWLKDFETKQARDWRTWYLTEKKTWRAKRDAAKAKWIEAYQPKTLKPFSERKVLWADFKKAEGMHAQFDQMYRTSGIEADAFTVEKGVADVTAGEVQAKAVYDEIFKQWQKLEEQWLEKLVTAETELKAAQDAKKAGYLIKMREADVKEATEILAEVRAAKPDVR